MTFTDAAAEVLRLVGRPLHYKEITDIAIEKNLLSHVGKSPEVTMGARLAAMLKKDSPQNPLVRVKPGVFALREWDEKTLKSGLDSKRGAAAKKAAKGRGRTAAEEGVEEAHAEIAEAEEEAQADMEHEEPAEPEHVAEAAPAAGEEEAVAGEEAPSTEEAAEEGRAHLAAAYEQPPVEEAEQVFEPPAAEAVAEQPISPRQAQAAARMPDAFDEEDEEDEDSDLPATEDAMRAEVAAGAAELFDEEDDDDQPILGGGDERPMSGMALSESDGRRRRRRRRRGRGGNAEPEGRIGSGPLPSYTATPMYEPRRDGGGREMRGGDMRGGDMRGGDMRGGDMREMRGGDMRGGDMRGGEMRGGDMRDMRGGDMRGGDMRGDMRGGDMRGGDMRGGDMRGGDMRGDMRGGDMRGGDMRGGDMRGGDMRGGDMREMREIREARDAYAEPTYRGPQVIELTNNEGVMLDDLAGRDLADAIATILATFDRNAGAVSLRQIAETAQRRGRLSGDAQVVQSQVAAAVRADNARRHAAGQRPRFRFAGGRVALTDWLLSGELERYEREALAAVERYREAARRSFARKLGELPGHAFVELCVLALERVGMSQLRAVRRAGASGGETHFSGVLRTPADDIRWGIVIRRDGREIGRERVTELRGSLHHYSSATAGWILTSGQVLSGAREEASVVGTAPITLHDGMAIARLCEENDVAVLRARLPIAIPDVDLLEALRAS